MMIRVRLPLGRKESGPGDVIWVNVSTRQPKRHDRRCRFSLFLMKFVFFPAVANARQGRTGAARRTGRQPAAITAAAAGGRPPYIGLSYSILMHLTRERFSGSANTDGPPGSGGGARGGSRTPIHGGGLDPKSSASTSFATLARDQNKRLFRSSQGTDSRARRRQNR